MSAAIGRVNIEIIHSFKLPNDAYMLLRQFLIGYSLLSQAYHKLIGWYWIIMRRQLYALTCLIRNWLHILVWACSKSLADVVFVVIANFKMLNRLVSDNNRWLRYMTIYSRILIKSSLPYFAKVRTLSGRGLYQDWPFYDLVCVE